MASWLEEAIERAVVAWLTTNGEALALKLAERYLTPALLEQLISPYLGNIGGGNDLIGGILNPNPKPEPAPEPAPEPQTGGITDDLDPAAITWVGDPAGVQGWEITSDLKVGFSGSNVLLQQDGTDKWPEVNGSCANAWVIVNRDGQWFGGSFEWMRRNSQKRAKSAVYDPASHVKLYVPGLKNWAPKSGETVYFMVAALSRGKYQGKWTWLYNKCLERTAIRKAIWP